MKRFLALVLFAFSAFAGTMQENVPTKLDPQQTYTLYLPDHYDAARNYPLLLIFDPRGRGTVAANIFKSAADEYGWILISSNNTRSDDDWEINERALRALLPELARYPADRVYATGFSGTSMVAWHLGVTSKALAGVIAVSGRLVDDFPAKQFSFANYGFAGEDDFNNREMRAIDALLAREGKQHRFRSFPGDHRWITPDLARDALGWMELIAMKEERRPRDEALIAKLYERELAAAKTLHDYRAVLDTFDGLRNVDDVRATVERLERDPAVQQQLKDEEKWDAFEAQYVKDMLSRIPMIFSGKDADVTARAMRELRVTELKRRAKQQGAEGVAARRALESLHVQMAFYLPRRFESRGEKKFAESALKVARAIHPE